MAQPMRTSSLYSKQFKIKQDGTLVGDLDTTPTPNKSKSNQ